MSETPISLKQIEAIKDELRQARNAEEIERVSDQHRPTVMAMKDDPELRVYAHQLANLKEYQLRQFDPTREGGPMT